MVGMSKGTVDRYAGLLGGMAEHGGSIRGYLGSLAARRVQSAQFRAAIAAVRLCGRLGLVAV